MWFFVGEGRRLAAQCLDLRTMLKVGQSNSLLTFLFENSSFFFRRFPSILKIFKNYEFCGLMTFCKLQCIFLESDGDDKKEEPEVLEELLNELRKLLVSTLVEQHLQSLIQNRQIVWRQSCCLFVASSTTLNKKLASFNMRLSC